MGLLARGAQAVWWRNKGVTGTQRVRAVMQLLSRPLPISRFLRRVGQGHDSRFFLSWILFRSKCKVPCRIYTLCYNSVERTGRAERGTAGL